jgi:hypothetical protein
MASGHRKIITSRHKRAMIKRVAASHPAPIRTTSRTTAGVLARLPIAVENERLLAAEQSLRTGKICVC